MLPPLSLICWIILTMIGLIIVAIRTCMDLFFPPISAVYFLIYCVCNMCIFPYVSEETYEQFKIVNVVFEKLLLLYYVYLLLGYLVEYFGNRKVDTKDYIQRHVIFNGNNTDSELDLDFLK